MFFSCAVPCHVKATWLWGAESKGETASRVHRLAERRVCASVTVETVRWSSRRSLREVRRASPARPTAARDNDASVRNEKNKNITPWMSLNVSKNRRRADLIPHGSEQISDGVPFIRPEPPQVWHAHGEMLLQTVCRAVFLHLLLWVPVCRGAEICILQLVRTTVLPAVSSRTTIGLSACSFSMRSLTSFKKNERRKDFKGSFKSFEQLSVKTLWTVNALHVADRALNNLRLEERIDKIQASWAGPDQSGQLSSWNNFYLNCRTFHANAVS